MIDENLCRAELSPIDRAKSTARRKAVYELLNPEAKAGTAGAIGSNAAQGIVAGATVPAIVQVWAVESGQRGRTTIQLIVNRTPVVAEISLYPGGDAYLRAGGLYCGLGQVAKGAYQVTIAITTPAIALVSDGKTPDLTPFGGTIGNTVGPALRRAH
ncbi:hypothetical protein [Mesorhizobium sp. CN2-181]|uniref:hypothetical protein n=1 Tax=Mesorhizobium yinganensis TaxID=3157707 RepID=UPI0032B83080